MTCPGCAGPISRGARLCAGCRKTAIAHGVETMLHPAAALAGPPVPATPRTPQQNIVYHGKCTDLASVENIDFLEAKERALAIASGIVGRALESSTELSELEMERVLEAIDLHMKSLGFVRRPSMRG